MSEKRLYLQAISSLGVSSRKLRRARRDTNAINAESFATVGIASAHRPAFIITVVDIGNRQSSRWSSNQLLWRVVYARHGPCRFSSLFPSLRFKSLNWKLMNTCLSHAFNEYVLEDFDFTVYTKRVLYKRQLNAAVSAQAKSMLAISAPDIIQFFVQKQNNKKELTVAEKEKDFH
uniref:Uncharacterized protein n=1 Tax=Romanomermis culicivorax TaxID=13658 RepID=A0A915KA47_ROMCU